MTLRVFSSGGGVQSTAALILSAQGRIDFPVHLFANVGDDSENPATLTYVRDVLAPYAAEHGIELVELQKRGQRGPHAGETLTLLDNMLRRESRSIPIPVRAENGAPGTRSCTMDFKINIIGRWLREHGATAANPATLGIGFSLDEIERAGRSNALPGRMVEYPLLDLGLNRADCQALTARAGLPAAPRSACWFCPMHRPSAWAEMRRDDPATFARAGDLERLLNERRTVLGKNPVYLTRFARPLAEAIAEAQATLFDPDGWGETCDEGTCFA